MKLENQGVSQFTQDQLNLMKYIKVIVKLLTSAYQKEEEKRTEKNLLYLILQIILNLEYIKVIHSLLVELDHYSDWITGIK